MNVQADQSRDETPPVHLWLFATAFFSGAVVMALEILGSRLLAPVFGNSLFVWGALIGVVLAAMSSGYATGGWLADRYPGARVLASLLLFSGVWTFLLAWMGQRMMFTVDSWIDDPRWGPCLAATFLLAPPAFGLSGVLPTLLRLTIADLGHLGRHTGRMIAVSTVGSLVGTFGTAFYLLTWMGSMALIWLLGAIQALLGLLWWWRAVTVRRRTVVPVVMGLGLSLWLALHPIPVLPEPVYQEDSPYQQVRVRDDDLWRYLVLDRTFHAIMWRVDPIPLYLPYSQLFVAALALPPDPTRALIMGQGGGSVAKWLAHYWPELEVDIVEVDPSVVRVAEEYFGYTPPPRHRVYVNDARVFLREAEGLYDVIWVDVFARHMIPFHLTTQEFFSDLRSRLHPEGVVVVNLASSGEGPDRERAQAVITTMRTVFPAIESFGVAPPWKTEQARAENLLFFAGAPVAQMREPEFSSKIRDLIGQQRLPAEAQALLSSRIEREWPAGFILTDDYAPYDLLVGRESASYHSGAEHSASGP
ncbi:MAG: fused MFS/spermidine synthase [Nitrospirales bacterium]